MTHTLLHFRALLLTALSFILTHSLQAATVRAYVEPGTAQTGQVVTYVVTIQGGTLQAQPQLRLPQQLVPNSPAMILQERRNINGVVTAGMRIQWQIAGNEPGEYTIPPQDLVIDGQPVKTNEVKFIVTEAPPPGAPDEQTTPIFEIEVGKTEVYQGEVVPLSASLYIPRRVNLRRVGLIDVNKSDFAISRFPQQGEQTEKIANGIPYQVFTYRTSLSPLHSGELKVGPANVEIIFEVFDNRMMQPQLPFGFQLGGGEARKLTVKSQEVKVKVLPLPTEDKPANFSGAVGDFSITATATPTELAVGDPLAVEVIVEGSGSFEAINAPPLTPPDGWRAYPSRRYNVDGPQDPNQIANFQPGATRRVGFSMVFVPEKIHPSLPSFELSFFSPTQKKYINARTAPIALNIKPGVAPAIESGNSVGSATNEPPKPPPVLQPKPQISDILVRVPEQPTWLSAATSTPILASQRFWAAQSIPVGILLFATLIALIRKKRASSNLGRRGELQQLWRGLEESNLSDRDFLQRAAHFIQRTHEGKPITDDAIQQILARYETQCFTASAPATPLTPTDRRSMLGTLRGLLQAAAVLFLFLSAAQLYAEDPAKLYQQARTHLEKGEFTKAQYFAENIVRQKPPALSAEVFTIIGHARYRQDDMGRAALWYQRAQLLTPRDPELRQNLRHLDEKLRFFTMPEKSTFATCSLYLSHNTWIIIATAGVWLVILSIAWRIFIGKKSPLNAKSRLLAVIICFLGVLIALPAAACVAIRPDPASRVNDIVVITATEVAAYTAATVTSGSVIDLPPGSQVKLLEKRGSWSYVEVPNSADEPLRGWIDASSYTPLWPWDLALLP